MPYPVEQNEKFAAYAHPERLVSTEWLAAAIDGGALDGGKLVVVESDEDVLLYETGHIPARSRSTGTRTSTTKSPATTSTAQPLPPSPRPRESPATAPW